MDLTGELQGITKDYKTGRTIIQLAVNEEVNGAEEIQGSPLRITLKRDRKRRSMDSNAYFHTLCRKLANKIGLSEARMKNLLIAEAGQPLLIDDREVLLDTELPPKIMLEQETVHCKLIDVPQEGKTKFTYRVYRGSHTYDSAEMARLINATIQDCKAEGIETATPDQLREMAEQWKKYRGEHE